MTLVTYAFIILLMMPVAAEAGNDARKGTAGALELLIPVGARSTALSGATTGAVSGVEALFWNPAGAARQPGIEAVLASSNYIADMDFSFIGGTVHLGNLGVMGLNIRVLNIGNLIVTTEDSPNGTGEIITPTFVTIGVSYARLLTDRVAIGVTGHYISEHIMQMRTNGLAFDIGFQYETGITGLALGMVMKNIGPDMKFSGPDLDRDVPYPGYDPQSGDKTARLNLAAFELPTFLQFGSSYTYHWNSHTAMLVSGSLRNNNYSTDEIVGGVEMQYKDVIFIRGGYQHSNQKAYIYGATFGVGMKLGIGDKILLFDYSNSQTKYFENIQWFSLTFRM